MVARSQPACVASPAHISAGCSQGSDCAPDAPWPSGGSGEGQDGACLPPAVRVVACAAVRGRLGHQAQLYGGLTAFLWAGPGRPPAACHRERQLPALATALNAPARPVGRSDPHCWSGWLSTRRTVARPRPHRTPPQRTRPTKRVPQPETDRCPFGDVTAGMAGHRAHRGRPQLDLLVGRGRLPRHPASQSAGASISLS